MCEETGLPIAYNQDVKDGNNNHTCIVARVCIYIYIYIC